jgi:hypothetical protein
MMQVTCVLLLLLSLLLLLLLAVLLCALLLSVAVPVALLKCIHSLCDEHWRGVAKTPQIWVQLAAGRQLVPGCLQQR